MTKTLRRIQRGSYLYSREVTDTATNTGVTVGNTSTPVLGANEDRIEIILVNDSDEVIYIALGPTAVMNEGIRLNSRGGSYLNVSYIGAVSAICTSGTKNLCVCEQ